ncbi:MAG: hypothetical protein IPK70_16560 [Flavobacteriales bacterium]|jgi:hypothetical protein|nr:hypothetical protein [Flavobacteriales bacterium]
MAVEKRVPQDRTLKAFRLAREFCKVPGISVDGIIEKIQAEEPGIDRETAWMAADQAVNERVNSSQARGKDRGLLALAVIVNLFALAFTGEWWVIPLGIGAFVVLWLMARINDRD